MKLLRILISVYIAFFVFSPKTVFAENEFSVDANVTYNVLNTGKTEVTHDITLTNNFSTLYATTYTLGLENIDVTDARATQVIDGKVTALDVDTQKNGDITNIKLDFPDAVVGRNSARKFSISYSNSSFAVRTGEVWEVSIPRLGDKATFRNYNVYFRIPPDFGLEAYISPKPDNLVTNDSGKIYTFGKNNIIQTGITAGFGQFQVFTFDIAYHLENPLVGTSKTEIALPPDTAFQKVYIQSISPKPSNVTLDGDGNWIANYVLTSRQRVDVKVTGSVQIFAGYRPFPRPTDEVLSDNLKESEYWQTGNPQIKALAAELKTPRAIYDYVSKTLTYEFARVQPNVQRMGAVEALKNPTQAICMEFTDLFIAIARAAGIPAREIDGYAYTENPELQPLSLVADVLHAWPEYYDKDKGVWIPVDPTWASTSGGVDYFDKLDLRHFTFVIHGESPITPYPPGSYKLGPNPQKDIFVSFGKLPTERIGTPSITISPVRTIPFLNSIFNAVITNNGPAAIYGAYPTIYFDGKEKERNFIDVLPPYAKYQMRVSVPFSLLGSITPSVVEVRIGEVSSKIVTNKTQVIVGSLLVVSFFLILITLVLLIRLRKITFEKLFARISRFKEFIYGKFTKKDFKDKNSL